MSTQPPKRPEIVFIARHGGVCIEAAVWCNEHQRDGRTITSQSVSVRKQYYDADTRSWQDSSTYFVNEIPMLQLVLTQAYQHIMLREKETSEASAAADQPA